MNQTIGPSDVLILLTRFRTIRNKFVCKVHSLKYILEVQTSLFVDYIVYERS